MTERLPQSYIPINYDLYIHYLKTPSSFEAKVSITFQKKEGGNQVYLYINNNITITKIFQKKTELTYTVDYPKLIINGSTDSDFDFTKSPIKIKYKVTPDTSTKFGFFSFKNSKYLTDFEPDGARCLLPCFDEPFVKATFSVTVCIPTKFTCISNMPSYKQVTSADYKEKTLYFLKTPPMCSYLLCICVGKFDYISGRTKRGIPVIFYYDSGPTQLDPEFVKTAIFTIDWMEEHFKVKYDLPLLQLITVDGFTNAMENYGLITLLEYPASASYDHERIIIHEVVHQWFGNLVSIKYWDSVWLNEGFARYLDMCIYNEFPNDDRKKTDFFHDKIAINCKQFFKRGIVCPDEKDIVVNQRNLFDNLVYFKGSFVTKMFKDLIGDDQFFKLCSKWLVEFSNKAANLNDFIAFVNKELAIDYTQFFDSWLRKMSFPVVMIKEIDSDSNKFKGITITQVNPNKVLYHFSTSVTFGLNGQIKTEKVEVKNLETKLTEIEYDWVVVNAEFGTLLYALYSKEILKAIKRCKSNDEFLSDDDNIKELIDSIKKKPAPDLIDDEMKQLAKDINE